MNREILVRFVIGLTVGASVGWILGATPLQIAGIGLGSGLAAAVAGFLRGRR